MYKLTHRVHAYTFDFCGFLSVTYTTLKKLFAVSYVSIGTVIRAKRGITPGHSVMIGFNRFHLN